MLDFDLRGRSENVVYQVYNAMPRKVSLTFVRHIKSNVRNSGISAMPCPPVVVKSIF